MDNCRHVLIGLTLGITTDFGPLGSISSNKIYDPKITMGTILALFPWGGVIVTIKIKGSALFQACERGFFGLPEEYGFYPQVCSRKVFFEDLLI